MLKFFAKILVFIVIIPIIISCNATKRVPEGKSLLEKNNVVVNDKKTSNQEVLSYLRQKPNLKVLGIPFSLHIYNIGNPNYTVPFRSKPAKEKFLTNIFSEKQVNALANSYKNINDWFLKSGNPPVISDSTQIERSVNSLYKYYLSKGYFDAEVSFVELKKNKRSVVTYNITTNDPYFIDSVSTTISSPVLDSLYQKTKDKSFVKKGNQINYNDLQAEENRLVELYRNSGIYHFSKNITEFWIDSLTTSYQKNVLLKIPNRVIEEGDSLVSKPFQIQKVKKVNVFTDFSFETRNQKPQDSAYYKGYTFYANDKLKFTPKYLANAIVIQPDSIYKDTERDLTRKYLRELQNFKPSVDIKYEELDAESLAANIYLSPLKKYSFGFDTEITTSNIKPFGVSGKFSLLNRNVFRGAEVLELSFQGSFLNIDGKFTDNPDFFNAYETGVNATLKIPRIVFFGNTSKIIPKRMTPQTNIGIGLSSQRNIGLDRQNLTGGIDYTWRSSKTTNHKLELLNVQYIKNQNPQKYFTIFNSEYEKLNDVAEIITPNPTLIDSEGKLIAYDYMKFVLDSVELQTSNPIEYLEVQKVNERRDILVEDFLVPVISYTYNYTNREELKDNDFSSVTARVISSGSLTSAFIKKPADGTTKKLFGVNIAHYLKTELEYKKYWAINPNSSFVHRSFIGVAFPFGNSNIPFSRSYRAGGANDIRAWRTFELGPGSEPNNLEFKTGTLKFTTNFEYRFKVINSIYSALFIDAGNIWDVTGSNVTSSEGRFKGFSSLNEIAIGSGFGLRYDFSFLVFRFDVGFKTYEPYLFDSNKWFKNFNFNNAVYQIGINYPF
ncbi:MAG: BamA/TamA family outer membrane protein [Flavobacteriaceae bacterium]|nr:BamA/TamA family outer membrane protein [Flavobacteriaceae bacterium]